MGAASALRRRRNPILCAAALAPTQRKSRRDGATQYFCTAAACERANESVDKRDSSLNSHPARVHPHRAPHTGPHSTDGQVENVEGSSEKTVEADKERHGRAQRWERAAPSPPRPREGGNAWGHHCARPALLTLSTYHTPQRSSPRRAQTESPTRATLRGKPASG